MAAAAARHQVELALCGGRLHHAKPMCPTSKYRHSPMSASSGSGPAATAPARDGWLRLRPVLLLIIPHIQDGLKSSTDTLASDLQQMHGLVNLGVDRLSGSSAGVDHM
jgi:hypothetical protein